MPRFSALLLAAVAMLLAPADADACSCAGPESTCSAFWSAQSVFVGRVASIGASPRAVGRRIEFTAAESLRGTSGGSLMVLTGEGGPDCGYPFQVGETYLVYASQTPAGELVTSVCSRTMALRASVASKDLSYARRMRDLPPNIPARITGTVFLDRLSMRRPAPVPSAPVTLTGAGGTFNTVADRRGRFTLRGVPRGTYDIAAVPPPGYATVPNTIQVNDPSGCQSINVYLRYDSRVTGRVVDGTGAPIRGLAVSLVPSDRRDFHRVEAWTEGDGTFSMRFVVPGPYVLGFNVRQGMPHEAHGAVFYPGVPVLSSARRVQVSVADQLRLPDFVVPSDTNLVMVSGFVIDEAGQPAPLAVLRLTDEERTYTVGGDLTTGPDGRFVVALVENRRYSLSARRRSANGVTTGTVKFQARRTTPPVGISLR